MIILTLCVDYDKNGKEFYTVWANYELMYISFNKDNALYYMYNLLIEYRLYYEKDNNDGKTIATKQTIFG